MSDSQLVNKSNLPREANKTADTTFDKIYKYYFGKKAIQLTDKQDVIRDRWEKAYAMLCDMKSPRKVAYTLIKVFKVSEKTAYLDINNAMMVFGDPKLGLKDAKRAIVNEWLIKGIDKADKLEDMQSYDRLIARYININGLDAKQDNPIADMLLKLKPTKIEFTLDAKKLQEEADKLMSDVEDIDYEDIETEEEDED